MNPPIKVLLITVYPLWAGACRQALESRTRELEVTILIADDGLSSNLLSALVTCPEVVLVSLDIPFEGLNPVWVLRTAGYSGAVMVICSHYVLPTLKGLAEVGVQSIVSSLASLDELVSSIYALADGHPDPLLQQHLRATRPFTHRPSSHDDLNEREREILQLVARDYTDQEIADHLQVSARTVSNQLHYIYAKLGVRGRTGAVIEALTKGLINLHS